MDSHYRGYGQPAIYSTTPSGAGTPATPPDDSRRAGSLLFFSRGRFLESVGRIEHLCVALAVLGSIPSKAGMNWQRPREPVDSLAKLAETEPGQGEMPREGHPRKERTEPNWSRSGQCWQNGRDGRSLVVDDRILRYLLTLPTRRGPLASRPPSRQKE